MEVHHHPHPEGKRLKHYLFEFFMLFLAVFCGFLAEYQLEHVIEHSREKKLMQSLANDLKLDTTALSTSIASKDLKFQNIDSSLLILNQYKGDSLSYKQCIKLFEGISDIFFLSNNGTISQLKNAGGLNLIRNHELVDSIEEYDRQLRRLDMRYDAASVVSEEVRKLLQQFINGEAFFNMGYKWADTGYAEQPDTQESLKHKIKVNNVYRDELIFKYVNYRWWTEFDIPLMKKIKSRADNLLNFISNAYHIKPN